ncbi:hypothetical protein GIB67_041435 [Kingdonia uniflora]|uniref:Uncharacterized protein n=1 Tax=Kingdonia uniflora TaxID=39325 RepID=A0A7J7LRR7_9MAGN|nr:hypothetical protein GIB67_041435 [Kingdonia uniflora]
MELERWVIDLLENLVLTNLSPMKVYSPFWDHIRAPGSQNSFKYIEAATMSGHFKEVERVTTESNFYDAEKTKNFLMEAKLPDISFTTSYSNNMLREIEGYVQKANPGSAPYNIPLVVGQLLDDDCPEDFINGLILSVHSLLPIAAFWKSVRRVLRATRERGKPRRTCTQRSRYVVERMNSDLWDSVLNPDNKYRRKLIDQVVSRTALAESKSRGQVAAAIKAFMAPDLSHELIEFLEKIVFQNPTFSGSIDLETLLLETAFKVDVSRVMDYINRLDNFDGSDFGEIAVKAQLYEEAFAAFKKFNLNVQAVNVLLDNIQSIKRAVEFAFLVEEDAVWSLLANAQHEVGMVDDAIESFMRLKPA